MRISRPPEMLSVIVAFIAASVAGGLLGLPLLVWLINLGMPALAGTGYAAVFLGVGWLGAYAAKKRWYSDSP